jgi:hypothetical protein
MTYRLVHGTVVDSFRKVIHAVRVLDAILDYREIDDIADMCARVRCRDTAIRPPPSL